MKLSVLAVLAGTALACIDVSTIETRQQNSGTDGSTADTVMCDPGCPPSSCTNPPPDPSTGLVSGLEYMCGLLDQVDGRDGDWFTYGNGDSLVSPRPGMFVPSCTGAEGSCHSACMSGQIKGDNYPYTNLGFNFRKNPAPYDLSRYRAVSFFLSGHVGAQSAIRFQIPLAADANPGAGGMCLSNCNDSYQYTIGTFGPPSPPTGWINFEIPFTELTRLGFSGAIDTWDPSTAIGLVWSVVASPGIQVVDGDDFTLCVDQVVLIPN